MSMNVSKNLSFSGAYYLKTPNEQTKAEVIKRINDIKSDQSSKVINPSTSTVRGKDGVKLIYSYPAGTDETYANGMDFHRLLRITEGLTSRNNEVIDEVICSDKNYSALSTNRTYDISLEKIKEDPHSDIHFREIDPEKQKADREKTDSLWREHLEAKGRKPQPYLD